MQEGDWEWRPHIEKFDKRVAYIPTGKTVRFKVRGDGDECQFMGYDFRERKGVPVSFKLYDWDEALVETVSRKAIHTVVGMIKYGGSIPRGKKLLREEFDYRKW